MIKYLVTCNPFNLIFKFWRKGNACKPLMNIALNEVNKLQHYPELNMKLHIHFCLCLIKKYLLDCYVALGCEHHPENVNFVKIISNIYHDFGYLNASIRFSFTYKVANREAFSFGVWWSKSYKKIMTKF